jgi:hypothetical protein
MKLFRGPSLHRVLSVHALHFLYAHTHTHVHAYMCAHHLCVYKHKHIHTSIHTYTYRHACTPIRTTEAFLSVYLQAAAWEEGTLLRVIPASARPPFRSKGWTLKELDEIKRHMLAAASRPELRGRSTYSQLSVIVAHVVACVNVSIL